MSKIQKIYAKLMSGQGDKNFAFDDACYLLSKLGFKSSQNASHISYKKGAAFANIQNFSGKAKPYQLAQIREMLKKHQIKPE